MTHLIERTHRAEVYSIMTNGNFATVLASTILLTMIASSGSAVAAFQPTQNTLRRSVTFKAKTSPVHSVSASLFEKDFFGLPPELGKAASTGTKRVARSFVEALNAQNVTGIIGFLAEDCIWKDSAYYEPIQGLDAIQRFLRLQLQEYQTIVVDEAVSNSNHVGLLFHLEGQQGTNSGRGMAVLSFDSNTNKIDSASWVPESVTKSGEGKLQLLTAASFLLAKIGSNSNSNSTKPLSSSSKMLSPPERYFDAWNQRDIDSALAVFAYTVQYDDTAFPVPFVGLPNLRAHLVKCADSFPDSFTFQIDGCIREGDFQVLEWHVENNHEPLPFSNGISLYRVKKSKIVQGIDFTDGEPIKPAVIVNFVKSMQANFRREPVRWMALLTWIAYMYIVFLSDGILPGANALQLEVRTWQEVFNLSLNFFLVAPALNLPFSPLVHPCLEGMFNLLLSWAALFAGFLSDDRRDKPNYLPMLPIVVGMQFLTSAFLLPYLAIRSSEERSDVAVSDLDMVSAATESRLLGPVLCAVGSYSIAWALLARKADFGGLAERWTSFLELLSIDRVGSSFVVDLVIFGIFQSWFVDDDLKRRGVDRNQNKALRRIGKYVPFFGMAAYLTLRPAFPRSENEVEH